MREADRRVRWRVTGPLLLGLVCAMSVGGSELAAADLDAQLQDRGVSSTTIWMSNGSGVESAASAFRRGEFALAVRQAQRALRRDLHPNQLEIALQIVCVGLTEQARPEEALPYCDRLVHITNGRDWRHLNNRANALLRTNEVDRAIEDYQRAVALLDEQVERRDGAALRVAMQGVVANLELAHRRRAALREGDRDGAEPPPPAPERVARSDSRSAGAIRDRSRERPLRAPAGPSPAGRRG